MSRAQPCGHDRFRHVARAADGSALLLRRSPRLSVRRRTKVIGRFPGESSCLSLCWAVLDLVISHSWVVFTDLERHRLKQLHDRPTATTREVSAA